VSVHTNKCSSINKVIVHANKVIFVDAVSGLVQGGSRCFLNTIESFWILCELPRSTLLCCEALIVRF
jgi:hypothetical protein